MVRATRQLYAWLAFFAFAGLTISLFLNAFNIDPVVITDQTLFHLNTAPIRIVAFFSYFTIWSNILVIFVGIMIATKRNSSKYFGNTFATALIMITITGLVYNTILLPSSPPQGWYWLTSTLMHLVAPIMYIYLWLKKGPRGFIYPNKSLQILTIPILYLLYTVARGLAIKQWPYKFLDLTSEGFLLWIAGVLVIFGFGLLLILGFSKLDRKPFKQ